MIFTPFSFVSDIEVLKKTDYSFFDSTLLANRRGDVSGNVELTSVSESAITDISVADSLNATVSFSISALDAGDLGPGQSFYIELKIGSSVNGSDLFLGSDSGSTSGDTITVTASVGNSSLPAQSYVRCELSVI